MKHSLHPILPCSFMCTILRNWLTSLAFWRNGHRFFHRSDKKGRALVMKFGRINFNPYRIPYSEVTWQRTTFQSTSFPDCLNYSSNLDCRVNLPSLTVFHTCPVLEQESSKKVHLGEKLSISPTKPEKSDFSDVTKHRTSPRYRNSPKMSLSTFSIYAVPPVPLSLPSGCTSAAITKCIRMQKIRKNYFGSTAKEAENERTANTFYRFGNCSSR